MKIRLYLDGESEKSCDQTMIKAVCDKFERDKHCWGNAMSGERANGVIFGIDEMGVFTEINTFVGGMPENIQCYTFRLITIYDESMAMYNAPLSGYINEDGVESVVDTYYNSSLPSKRQGEFWRIRISAPTWESAINRYKDIRSGKAFGEVWTGGFVQNVTHLAEAMPELLKAVASLKETEEEISGLKAALKLEQTLKKTKKGNFLAQGFLTEEQLVDFFKLFDSLEAGANTRMSKKEKDGGFEVVLKADSPHGFFVRASFEDGLLHAYGWDEFFEILE